MSIIIRPVTEADFENLFSLIKEFAAFQHSTDKLIITLDQLKNDRDLFRCFVATNESGNLIGYASYYFTYYSWSGKGLHLDDLYVSPDYRGLKIGTMLLENIIDTARKEACKKARWQVSGWNKEAISFYKKMGAIIDPTEINCDLIL